LHEIVELLRRHGVVVESLTKRWRTPANLFRIDSVVVQPLFEGHRTVQVEGRWRSEPFDTTLAPGWYLVRTDQSLGVLASYLLEPASEDGVLTWNLLDRELSAGATYPILRVDGSPGVPATTVP
jgi:dipeptidyl-peptidase 4